MMREKTRKGATVARNSPSLKQGRPFWQRLILGLITVVSGLNLEEVKRAQENKQLREKNRREWMALMRLIRRLIFWLMIILPVLFFALLGLYKLSAVSPISTLMLKDMVLMRDYQRQWVALEDISPHLVNAVLMSEDGRFCSHSGVDWQELHGQITREGGPARGASTISMQVVKNLFLWQEPIFTKHWSDRPLSYLRKGLEIPLAIVADFILSKKRMMEIYLNIAEWGPGIYGIEAAAQHYFKRSAARLTPRQGALLALTLPNPYLRQPNHPSSFLNRLAPLIQNRAARSGAYIGCLK